jgi:hypothetical protein
MKDHAVKKYLHIVILTLSISSCSIFNFTPKSVPYPSDFQSLDAKAVNYIRNAPKVKLSKLNDQSQRKNQTLPEKDILVSVSGGGSRAAAFTLGVLAELEHLGKWTNSVNSLNALKEIDYFSTVSGGGWGVSSYMADKVAFNKPDYSLNRSLPSLKAGFLMFSQGDIDCLPTKIEKHITKGLTIGDLLAQPGGQLLHPYMFVNGTIYSNQSPFVFTSDFSDYYKIDTFGACKSVKYKAGMEFNNLPMSYAVATSGSVPGFYHNFATTKICEPSDDNPLYDSFFCAKGKSHIDKLILIDGGIYDNYGYQTALEVIEQSKGDKVIIIIDTNADTEMPFVRDEELSKNKVGFGTLTKAGFPARTSAYNRMFKTSASAIGADVITLDFFSVADFITKTQDVDREKLLSGLGTLTKYANTVVYCFAEDGTYLDNEKEIAARGDSEDCKANNFYRSGLRGKTTYKFDPVMFDILAELGRLAVRVNANEIRRKLYE